MITLAQDKRPEILKISEIRSLLYQAKAENHPWYPIWATVLLTGMRSGELYALKWSDVDMDNGLITVQRSYERMAKIYKSTKAGYWRSVPISEELKTILIDLRLKSTSEFVLEHLGHWQRGEQSKVLRAFCRQINLTPIKFHTLRACFATQLLGEGVKSSKVMKICGWCDLRTMARYIRLAGIDERGATESLKFLSLIEQGESNVRQLHSVD